MNEVVWRYCCSEVLKTIGAAGICGAGTHRVSVFFSETVRPKAPQTSTRIIILSSTPRDDRGTLHTSSAYYIPKTARRTHSCAKPHPLHLAVDKVGEDVRVLREALQRNKKYAAKKMFILGAVPAPPRTTPSMMYHYRSDRKLSSHRGNDGLLSSFEVTL